MWAIFLQVAISFLNDGHKRNSTHRLYWIKNMQLLDPTIKMVVFDKDGTLGDCTPSMHNWCKKMTQSIIKDYNSNHDNDDDSQIKLIDTIERFHSAIGWDNINNCLLPSAPLSAGTWQEIIDLTCQALLASGSISNTVEKVNAWHRNLGSIHSDDEPLIPDLQGFLEKLKRSGLLISICTSDDRKATNDCIKAWGLDHIIDFSVCGDEVLESKPSAYPLLRLCKLANIKPENCVVIGDTYADTGMGKNGNAKLVVGVLTGSGTSEQLLDTGAHIVLPDISFLSQYLLVPSDKTVPQIENVDQNIAILSTIT